MPENTDTQSSVSEIDVSGFETLQGVTAPVISLPDATTDHRLRFVEIAKQLLPRHAYTSDQWLLNELRDDKMLRSTLVDNIIQRNLEEDQDFYFKWNSEDDDRDEFRETFRKNLDTDIFEDLNKAVVKGETHKQSILQHHKLRSSQTPEYDITNPLNIVNSTPEEFEEWLDVRDIKNNKVSDDMVRGLYEGDDDFKEAVIKVNLRNFEQALGNRANQGVFDPTRSPEDASEYAKAYAIYTRFGSEALTDYVNILQHYTPGARAQDNRVISAFRRFRDSPQYRGVDIFGYAADFIKGRNSLNVDRNDAIAPFQNYIQKYADEHDINPALLAGIITQESIIAARNEGVSPTEVISPAGAVGLMQLMPHTARDMGLIVNDEIDERTDPEKNIMAGTKLLGQQLKRFDGDEVKALAAYNAGQGQGIARILKRAEEAGTDNIMDVLGEGFYSETAGYIPKVQQYRDHYAQYTDTIDGLEFQTREPLQRKPHDWNTFTARTFYTADNDVALGSRQRAGNFINEVASMIIDGTIPRADFMELMGVDDQEKGFEPINMFEALNAQYERQGIYFPTYPEFTYELVEEAMRGENYTIDDLIGTLAANAVDVELNDVGNPVYIVDYGELQHPENFYLRAIADGLNTHGLGDGMVTKIGETLRVEPDKQARRDRQMAQRWIFSSQPRPIWDEDARTLVGWEEHIPNNFLNTAAGVAVGVSNILPEAWGGIVGGWGGNIAEWMGAGEGVMEFFDNQRHKSRDYYSGTLMDFTDPVWEPFGMPFSLPDIGMAGGTLGGYLVGINILGKGGIKALGAAGNLINKGGAYASNSLFQSMSALRKAQNFREFYRLAPRSTSPAAVNYRNMNTAVSKNLPYTTWPKFVVGSAAIETFTDPEYSLAGLVTQGFAAAGVDMDWNPDRTYRTSGHLARWGMDFVAGEFLGLMFDGMIGVSKLANDHTFRALRGKPKLGLEYKDGRYLPETESGYNTWGGTRKYLFPEIQRFAYNVRNNANNIPTGDIRKAAMDYVAMRGVGPQYFGDKPVTQADIAAKVIGDGNEFMSTMREDLRSIITDASETYGGTARLSESDILKLTDEVYDELMDTLAKQAYSLLGRDQEWNANVFARHLEDHPGDLIDLTPLELNGQPTVSRAEAQILKNRHPGSHVIPVGDGTYKVYQNDPALWRFDLANRIRQYANQSDTFEGNVNRHVSRYGLDYGKVDDEADITTVIETLESTQGVGVRVGDREGVISGFSPKGWEVRWDDGTDDVFGTIRGVEGLPERPPDIAARAGRTTTDAGGTPTARGAVDYDEAGRAIEEDVTPVTSRGDDSTITVGGRAQWTSQGVDQFETPRRITDIRTDADGQQYVQFEGSNTYVPANEITGYQRGIPSSERTLDVRPMEDRVDEAIPLPGVVRLEHIAEQDRAAFEAYRAGRDMEPDDITRLQTYYRDRLVEGLRTRNDENILKDIQTLRAMGMGTDEIDELIQANALGDAQLTDYYRNFNRAQEFGDSVTDDLLASRVDAKRTEQINDESFQALNENTKTQMIEQADLLASTKGVDEPQRLIDNNDPEITSNRSWETSNERFRDNRPNEDGLSPKGYSVRLAEDLGTGTVRDIAKLQKTRANGTEKVPIRTITHADLIGNDGKITPIKNSKGLVVRVEPLDGGLPYYAIGRKNNIKGFPSRFVADQNGGVITNQEWAFINPNVTQRPDGQLKRFKPYTLENGEVVYREHAYGTHVLNIQNPVRVDKYDLTGRALKGNDGKNIVTKGMRTDEVLTPERVFKHHVDAIEIREPGSSRVMYRPVSPEGQVFRHGKPVSDPGDQRVPHVTFETIDEPLNAGEVLARMSKVDEKKVYNHAWLAIPGMIATGGIGIDENGELTTAAKVGLALGAIGIGGVMIRSMRGNFKIRNGYDKLSPQYKQTFDQFDWRKVDENGTPIRSQLTDDESAMFNRLKGVPKDDYKMLRDIMYDYDELGISRDLVVRSNEEIPELAGELRQIRDTEYQQWSTGFSEDGRITPKLTEVDQRVTQQVETIGLELDPAELGLIARTAPSHLFTETDGSIMRPIAWARVQKTPDGRLLLDELQVDNALQKGEFGISGDVNRDLYSAVLDDVVERAIRESDGEFYVTRGNLQASRYGGPALDINTLKEAQSELRTIKSEIFENRPEFTLHTRDLIDRAKKIVKLVDGDKGLDHIESGPWNTLLNDFYSGNPRLRSLFNKGLLEEEGLIRDLAKADELPRHPGAMYTRGRHFLSELHEGNYRFRMYDQEVDKLSKRILFEQYSDHFPNFRDFESFLNDRYNIKGVVNFYDNTLPNVIRKRYGAEIVDAMGSPKEAYDSPGEAFHRVIVTEEGLRNARNKTGKRINWELIPGSAALAGMAYAAYNMEHIGQQPGTDTEVEKAGLGVITTALMIAAAAGMARGRFRTKVGGNIKGKVRNNPANVADRTDAKALEIDGARMDRRHLHELNAHINPNDPSSLRRMDGFWRGLRTAMKAGRNVSEWFSDSAYTQAGIQHLRKISEAIKTATGTRGRVVTDDIINYLLEANNAPAKLMAKLDTRFNDTLGYGQGAFREFGDTKGAQFVNNLLGEPIPPQEARVLFGDAVTRLMNRGATMNEGRPIVKTDIPPNVRQQYEGDGGDFLQRLDDAMLRDPEMMDYVDTLHYGYREVRKEYLGLLAGEMGRRLVRFRNRPDVPMDSYRIGETNFSHEDVMRLLEDWVTDNRMLTYRDFLKTLDNPDERQLMRVMKAKSDMMFGDIVDIQNMRRRFTDLEGRYVPQMVDFDKVNAARQRYVDDATSRPELMDEAGVSTPEDYAQRMMYQDFKDLNQVGDGRGLIGFDEETLSLSAQRFATIDDARQKLVSVIRNGATNRIQEEWDQIFGDRQLTNELMEEMGFVRRVTDAEGKTEFELRQPENLEVSEDIFEIANNMRFEDYYNRVMIDPAIKKSNFLENPRKFHLPLSWMKTDPADVWKAYSFDTGTRLHSLRHGIYKGDDFERNFMEPMQSAMQRVGYTPEQSDNTVTRVREMHDTQFGIMRELVGLSTSEANTKLHRMRTTNAMLQTYRNLDYSKRMYGFKYLNWFQLLVSTLPMTSTRALASAMGVGPDALSQGGLKRLEGMFKDLHTIKEKDLSFRFDIQPGDPTGEHGNVSAWAHKNSQRLADSVSDFSIEKSALRLFGVDVGNSSRIFRMVTSSFHDTNVMNTAMNGWAFMVKAQEIARIARQMQLQGIQPDQVYRASDGSQHGWEAIYRQLEDVGVSRYKMLNVTDADGNPRRVSEADYFIEKEAEMSAWMDRMKRNERVSINDFEGNHADIIENMWHFATETYHGTNRVMRPEKWNTPLGRTLSMYASFTFNIGMQNVKRRMLDPVNNWITRYGTDADGNQQIGKMQLPALMKAIRNGDEDTLRAAGIANPKMAIAEFPLDSIDTMRRGVAGMGFGIATYTTLDVMRDIYAYPVQAALGIPEEERFRRTRLVLQDGIINPYASPAHQVSMGDLFGGEADAQDMMRIIAWGIGKVGQSSYGGMYLSPFDSVSKYGFRGVGGLAPSVGIADRFASDIVSLIKPPLTLNFDEMPGESAKFLMNNLPIVGSNVFTESRSAARDRINEYQRELRDE